MSAFTVGMRDPPLQLRGLLRRMLREVCGIQNGRPLRMSGTCFCAVLIDVFARDIVKVGGAPFFRRVVPLMYDDTDDGVDSMKGGGRDQIIFFTNVID